MSVGDPTGYPLPPQNPPPQPCAVPQEPIDPLAEPEQAPLEEDAE
jgi:hypothetical protein